jgi:NAD(P)-dependent dehydrogenase (short-subunit alcohol dehydrogenase family)
MKILVIGGTGMVGSTVVTGLLKQGVMVRVLSHSPEKLKKLPTGVEGFRADLDDPDTLPAAFDGIDGVFLLNAVGLNETDEGLFAVPREPSQTRQAARVWRILQFSVQWTSVRLVPHIHNMSPDRRREDGHICSTLCGQEIQTHSHGGERVGVPAHGARV